MQSTLTFSIKLLLYWITFIQSKEISWYVKWAQDVLC